MGVWVYAGNMNNFLTMSAAGMKWTQGDDIYKYFVTITDASSSQEYCYLRTVKFNASESTLIIAFTNIFRWK